MIDFQNTIISVYGNVTDTTGTEAPLADFLNPDQATRAIVDRLRAEPDEAQRKAMKKQLPVATISGLFRPTRKAENLVQHSGLICIDIDGKDNPEMSAEQIKDELARLEEVAYASLSVSGKGVFCIVPIATPRKHKAHFRAIEADFKAMGIVVDPACKDVCRGRIMSYDSQPYYNPSATTYTYCKEEPRLQPPRPAKHFDVGTEDMQVERYVRACERYRLNVAGDYDSWFHIGAALTSMGERGRGYFHRLSALDCKYNPRECDMKFSNLLSTTSRVGLGTFFHYMQQWIGKGML
jgi:hypothetical protein